MARLDRHAHLQRRPLMISPEVEAAMTSFTKQSRKGRMDHAPVVESKVPTCSGVTEAACKVLVRQRLCSLEMRWKEVGGGGVGLAVLDVHDRSLVAVLGQDRPVRAPGRDMVADEDDCINL
jgi:hypothetical protein